MKILQINKFLYPKGGDAICTLKTGELLESYGHEVTFWGMKHSQNTKFPNSDIFVENFDYNQTNSFVKQIHMTANLLYSMEAKTKMDSLIKRNKPDIAHLHNFAHQISPSILRSLKKHKIPIVMTMHDYKLICPSYKMLSKGNVCEKCKNKKFYNCFFNKCTKESYLKSLLNTIEMYSHHSIFHIYELIDIFISPSLFLKEKVKEMGFLGKVVHLSNFINLNKFNLNHDYIGDYFLYFGRLSKEKGLKTLIEAIQKTDIPLKIIGDGPMKHEIKKLIENNRSTNVQLLDYMEDTALKGQIRNSYAVILPSEWYENNPLSIIESFALGKPVIASRIGGIKELVQDYRTGLTFEPKNAVDLFEKVKFLENTPDKCRRMGKTARKFVEEELNEKKHYEHLMKIYLSAIQKCNKFSN